MKKVDSIRVNGERLNGKLAKLGRIGALPGGGVCRTALSNADKEARDQLKKWMEDIGLDIVIDEIGNMFGIYPGKKNLPALMFGSHLDTVSTGGLFDGSLGVLAGLELIETLHEAGIKTDHPLILANFTNEEGVRFVPDMMGSLAFSKRANVEELHKSVSLDGTEASVKDELKRIGYLGKGKCGDMDIKAFLELHIEQGPILESAHIDIGIVEKVQGIYWTEYIIVGKASHAGTTPMNRRKDAAYAAFTISSYLRDLVKEQGGSQVGTVGNIELYPNLINVTAEKAKFVTDLRNPVSSQLEECQDKLDSYINRILEKEDLKIRRKELVRLAPINFNPAIINSIENTSESLAYSSMHITSGAGHDAQLISTIFPSAMIFIASKDGLSHNIKEYSSPSDIEKGANVLLHSVLSLAGY